MPLCLYIGSDQQGTDDLRVVLPSPPDFTACQFVALTPQEFQLATGQAPAFDSLGITPAEILAVFGWAFAAVILFWFFGFVIGVASDVIKKL